MKYKSLRKIRHQRIRKKLTGTEKKPRFAVFRSNKHIYAQIIDDAKHQTLVSSSSIKEKKDSVSKIDIARKAGETLAKKALIKKIKKVVFDRAGFKYHGRIKAIAEGARKGGLDF